MMFTYHFHLKIYFVSIEHTTGGDKHASRQLVFSISLPLPAMRKEGRAASSANVVSASIAGAEMYILDLRCSGL